MRWRPTRILWLLLLLVGERARAQSMSSSEFVPPTAAERAQLAAASKDVLPTDVRRNPERFAATRVYWTGVTAGGSADAVVVEHHYFDGAVEGNGSVWLSPWSEGRFCLLNPPARLAARFRSERPRFVRAYGRPQMTVRGLCLRDAFVVVDERPWTTMVLAYGPDGTDDFSSQDAAAHDAVRVHPEERLITPFGYRAVGGALLGKTNLDDSALGFGWNAGLELSLRPSLRTEFALMTGVQSYPSFDVPSTVASAALFRYSAVGLGIAAGPVVLLPLHDDEPVWLGLRYLPTLGDALGAWALSPVLGGGFDFVASPDGNVRFTLQMVLGIDGNFGK
ncbi:MAG: hypothetical protein R3B13_08445 [Polyangiaceae bacterium]